MSRRMRLSVRGYPQSALFRDPNLPECAFPLRRCSGGAGRNPPPDCGALWKVAQLGKCARATPRQAAGGCAGDPQASAWGLTARKSAVWAEGLADGAPWVRPGHHQAASCGLRRCRELGLREFVWVAASLPWRRGGCHRQAARRNSVHRSPKTASQHRFEALVYTVALWAWVVGGLGIAIVYTNGRIGPLGAVLGHLCTLLRRELYDANYVGWYEHLNHHGVPVAPPCWSLLSWSGRQALREWRRR